MPLGSRLVTTAERFVRLGERFEFRLFCRPPLVRYRGRCRGLSGKYGQVLGQAAKAQIDGFSRAMVAQTSNDPNFAVASGRFPPLLSFCVFGSTRSSQVRDGRRPFRHGDPLPRGRRQIAKPLCVHHGQIRSCPDGTQTPPRSGDIAQHTRPQLQAEKPKRPRTISNPRNQPSTTKAQPTLHQHIH